ncbi:MAG: hypothetical protein NT172_18335, partial [Planctomycetota bacterium]|nr:hypothetical protein [Planctomycetota bacterium]
SPFKKSLTARPPTGWNLSLTNNIRTNPNWHIHARRIQHRLALNGYELRPKARGRMSRENSV